jgi:hypothetical protein
MANPNIMGVSAIRGKTTSLLVPTTSCTIVTNPASSGQLYKINSILASNVTATAATVTLYMYSAAETYTATSGNVSATAAAYTLTVPMSAGPFLATSTTITGSGISPISTGTGATVGAITISTTNYSIAITGTSGASAGALTTLSWTNPAIERALAVNVTVPGNSSLVLLSKDSSIYLEEGDYLYLSAGTTNAIHATCGFEVIG